MNNRFDPAGEKFQFQLQLLLSMLPVMETPGGDDETDEETGPQGPQFVLTYNLDFHDNQPCDTNNCPVELEFGGAVAVDIDWGDGSETLNVTGPEAHVYDNVTGLVTIRVSGTFEQFGIFALPDGIEALVSVDEWGPTNTTDLSNAFYEASNLSAVAEPPPEVTDMSNMFFSASAFNGDVSTWQTGNVTDMQSMFRGAVNFNQDIGSWDTANVTAMQLMFLGASSFNQDIGSWQTASVIGMNGMFDNAISFNQDISGWDTSAVQNMDGMFRYASVFNQDLSGWDVSSVVFCNYIDTGANNWDLAFRPGPPCS